MSIRSMLETVIGGFDQKRRWRQYKARKAELPMSHRTAIDAIERYLLYAGGIADGEIVTKMLEDLIDLFEQSAADGTTVDAIVGDDPVEFAEEFARNYSEGSWINKERNRLNKTIRDIDEPGHEEGRS
ncbi:MAG: DUF1048 domain-containing protein [Nocardioides sp.]|uniref:DUF1048 domain-containing protein n=1 Tax=Nocardioides sp. TaxID=35761 RepID=UPI003D6A209A